MVKILKMHQFLLISCTILFCNSLSKGTTKRQEVDDAIQYLADLDRVYSEHVRPRFGKRGIHIPDQESVFHYPEETVMESKRTSGMMMPLMLGKQAMKSISKLKNSRNAWRSLN